MPYNDIHIIIHQKIMRNAAENCHTILLTAAVRTLIFARCSN